MILFSPHRGVVGRWTTHLSTYGPLDHKEPQLELFKGLSVAQSFWNMNLTGLGLVSLGDESVYSPCEEGCAWVRLWPERLAVCRV